ncbi:ATP-binding protein [Enterococcus sp. BWM-S5]|uniref:ATP-binding protein n=1 Tax=Enterococcus larvae TaxID=2794352 RepID=A0ABS4CLI9_9ENTE|nr:ATP-binding protein [Enterococcus larvae]MBP1047142.1 ATP-binding protein [Enterococcus larvae]
MAKKELIRTPLKTIHNNMILTKDGDIWAYYKVKPDEINNHNFTQRENSKNRKWNNFLKKTLSKFEDIELFSYPKDLQLKARFDSLWSEFSPDSKDAASYYANATTVKLEKELGMITTDAYILGVKLKNVLSDSNPLEAMKNTVSEVTDTALHFLGKERPLDFQKFNNVKVVEYDLRGAMRGVKGTALTEGEMTYLYRSNFIRGITHDAEIEALRKNNITNAILDSAEHPGFIKIQTDGEQSWLSLVPIAETELNATYNHYFELARNMNFPCEFKLKGHLLEMDGMRGFTERISRLKRRYQNDYAESTQSGNAASDKNKEALYALNRLENAIDKGEPLWEWLGCYVVYGKTVDECKRRSDSLIRTLGKRSVEAIRPAADQLSLFYQLLQGKSVKGMNKWLRITAADTIAETLFAVTNNVGNNVGWYIGRVDSSLESDTRLSSIAASRNVVLFNPLIANQGGQERAKTRSPHIVITGETGTGKSYLMNMLFLYSSFMKIKILLVDPKKEKRKQFEKIINSKYYQQKYPLFVEQLKKIRYTTLDVENEKNHGVLDPIVFLKGASARDTAHAMFDSVYPLQGKEEVETALLTYLDIVIDRRALGERVGMKTVIQLMMESEDQIVGKAAALMEKKINNSILELGFSDGSTEALNLQSRLNVLEISGMELPDDSLDVEDYDDIHKKSLCLMLPLGKFCEKFGSENPNEFTMEFFDEAWLFTKARGGKAILKSMKRTGRSMNNALVYGTQSVKDTQDENDQGQFGTVFAFDEPSERKAILQHVGIEDSETNEKLLSGLLQGQCLYRDIYGRVAKISIHNLFEEFDKSGETVKETASSQAERKYAAA